MRSDYVQKQKQLGEIISVILENPTADVLEKNLSKLKELIEVNQDSLELRIKIIKSEEQMKPKKPLVK